MQDFLSLFFAGFTACWKSMLQTRCSVSVCVCPWMNINNSRMWLGGNLPLLSAKGISLPPTQPTPLTHYNHRNVCSEEHPQIQLHNKLFWCVPTSIKHSSDSKIWDKWSVWLDVCVTDQKGFLLFSPNHCYNSVTLPRPPAANLITFLYTLKVLYDLKSEVKCVCSCVLKPNIYLLSLFGFLVLSVTAIRDTQGKNTSFLDKLWTYYINISNFLCVFSCVGVGSPCGADPLWAPGNGDKTAATNRGSATDVGRQGNSCTHAHTRSCWMDCLSVSVRLSTLESAWKGRLWGPRSYGLEGICVCMCVCKDHSSYVFLGNRTCDQGQGLRTGRKQLHLRASTPPFTSRFCVWQYCVCACICVCARDKERERHTHIQIVAIPTLGSDLWVDNEVTREPQRLGSWSRAVLQETKKKKNQILLSPTIRLLRRLHWWVNKNAFSRERISTTNSELANLGFSRPTVALMFLSGDFMLIFSIFESRNFPAKWQLLSISFHCVTFEVFPRLAVSIPLTVIYCSAD